MQYRETNRSIYHYWLIMGLLLTTVTLVGCIASQSDGQGNESAVSDTRLTLTAMATATSIPPSATPASSSTPTPTATGTPPVTPTVSPTPVPTLTPLPTVAPQQRGQVYAELMSSNGGCVLPCWWGIELGVTPIEYVEQLYASLGASITIRDFANGRSRITALFVDPQIENGIQVRHTFRAQDDIVIEAEIEVVYDPNYQIEPLLQRLGQPDEVWLWTIPDTYEGVLPVSLRLFFPESGVMVSYAVFGERVGDVVQACFDDVGGTILLLWEPTIWNADGSKGFVERANESSELTLQGHRPIDEVSNWDAGQFYTMLTDPNRSECLQTPSNLWSPP